MSDNKITEVHRNIFQLKALKILNLENNEIRRFPTELGMMKLRNISLKGNPCQMLKNAVFRKVNIIYSHISKKIFFYTPNLFN